MPSEFRHIVFGNSELRLAIDSYDNASLPPGQLQSVRFRDEVRDHLVLELRTEEGGDVKTVVLPTSIIADSLIRYCIQVHVPLPRNAQNALTMLGDNIALELQAESKVVEVTPSQTADPGRNGSLRMSKERG